MRGRSLIEARRWTVVIAGSLGLGIAFHHFQVPAAWILAGIVASAAVALFSGSEIRPPRAVGTLGRGVIGVLAGLPLVGVSGTMLFQFLPGAVVATLLTLGIGIAGGVLLSRHERSISPETGILSMLAGGASMMPALAAEVGADFRYVTLSQYLRLLVVSVSLPLVAWTLGHPPTPAESDVAAHLVRILSSFTPAPDQPLWLLVILIATIVIGEPLGRRLRIPVPSVLTPMVLAIGVSLALPGDLTVLPPYWLKIVAFLSIGWSCGGGLSLPALKFFAHQLPATLLFLAVLLAGCAATAGLLGWWWHTSFFEAYLATSPGALETVLALSNEGGAGPGVITTQVVRLVAVVVLAGFLPQLVAWLLRLLPPGSRRPASG